MMIQLQDVRIAEPPAHEYLVQCCVPILGGEDNLTLRLDGRPTDTRVIAHARSWTIYELSALAAGGDGSFDVAPGPRASGAYLAEQTEWMRTPGLVRLAIDGTEYSLTGPAQSWHRRGALHRTLFRHVPGLGHVWITARAGARQLDFQLLLHNGIPGPDRHLSEVRLILPPGATWAPALPDPACSPPTFLVRPGSYSIPQQRGRPFFFSVFAAGAAREPERVGIADWGRGGYLPSAFAVPADLPPLDSQPAMTEPDPSYLPAPRSVLWPVSLYTSSIDRYPLDGVRWAAGDPRGLDIYRTMMLRSQARARVRFEADGSPLRLDEHAPYAWRFFNGFSAGQDAPWEWDRWQTFSDGYPDHDQAEQVHRLAECWALVWLANDPMAKLLALEGATRGRLTFWEGPGRAHNFDLPEGWGDGSTIGAWEANAALAIAFARCVGATEYEPWAALFQAHLRRAQMPSGAIVARVGQYPSDHHPFYGGFMLQGGEEFAELMLAAYSLGGADDVVRLCARGAVGIASDDDAEGTDEHRGLYYYAPTGPASGGCFFDEHGWPEPLHSLMGEGEPDHDSSYYTAQSMGYVVALAWAVGAPERFELLRRFTGTTVLTDAQALMRSWGALAPDEQTRAPVEQFWPLMGVGQ